MRGVAIILVILTHSITQNYVRVPYEIEVWQAICTGRLGVTLFFILSGFLITTLLLKELESNGRINLNNFYWRRGWRILPAYATFVVVLGFLSASQLVTLGDNDLWHMLTLTSNLGVMSWYGGHTWSTSTQEQFYLLWPAAILLLGRRKGLYAALGIMLVLPLTRFCLWMITSDFIEATPYYPYTIVDAIATGAALACARPWLQQQTFYQRLLSSRLFPLVPTLVILGCLLGDRPRINAVFGIGMRHIGIALCLDWAMTNYKGRVGRFLNSRPLVFVGHISFSVYLWQQLFISPHPAARAPYNLIALGLVALASYYWIEQPAIAAGRKLENWFAVRGRGVGSDEWVRQSVRPLFTEQNIPADTL